MALLRHCLMLVREVNGESSEVGCLPPVPAAPGMPAGRHVFEAGVDRLAADRPLASNEPASSGNLRSHSTAEQLADCAHYHVRSLLESAHRWSGARA